MKKLWILPLAAVMMVACGGEKEAKEEGETAADAVQGAVENMATDMVEDMAEVIELSQYNFIMTEEELNMFATAKQPATTYNDVSIDLDLL